jgi:hypothetical protein
MERRTEALVTLLFDEDPKVAVQAMEKLIHADEPLDEVFEIYQDSSDPHVRKRIHQISTVVSRQKRKEKFKDQVRSTDGSLIDALIQLSILTNPRLSEAAIRKDFHTLVLILSKGMEGEPVTTDELVGFMRSNNFFVPETFALEEEMLMTDIVLKFRLGSAIILSALAFSIGRSCGWEGGIVIYDGHFCLIDKHKKLINPTLSWKITDAEPKRCFPCRNRDILYNVLCQLFLTSLQDGDMQEIHLYGSLLTELFDSDMSHLPYPVGNELLPKTGG